MMGWRILCDWLSWDMCNQKYVLDTDINVLEEFPEPAYGLMGDTEDEIVAFIIEYLRDLFGLNALWSEYKNDMMLVWASADDEPCLKLFNFRAQKTYVLLNEHGEEYESVTPGTIGGHRKLKIYGRLDCPSAVRYIAKGQYAKYRVFFRDEETAKAAGYRPCAVCMKQEYAQWKRSVAEQSAE